MSDIFGEIESSPELEVFDRLLSPFDFEEAWGLYKVYIRDGLSHEQALACATEEVVPSSWFESSRDQLQEQQSS